MKGEDQAKFVKNTEDDCDALDTSGTMAWEWFGSWENAIKTYFPRYSENNIVKGFFLVNVPYIFPIEAFRGTYKVIDNVGVMFKPLADWQHSNGGPGNEGPIPDYKDNMTPEGLAGKISNMTLGSVTYVYMTHDAGNNLDTIYDCVSFLDEHVEVVNHNNLVEMALAKETLEKIRNIDEIEIM